MYHIAMMFSKYFFYIFIVLFLINSTFYISLERNYLSGSKKRTQRAQFMLILMNLLIAFMVFFMAEPENFMKITKDFAVVGIGIICVKMFFPLVYKKSCPLMLNIVLFLISIGLIFLYRINPDLAKAQSIHALLGFVIILALPLLFRFIPMLDKLTWVYFGCGLFLVLLPTFLNNASSYGGNNWVELGPITFQPSEFVKFFYVFYLASLFNSKFDFKKLVISVVTMGIFVLVLVMQNDFGGALIFFMTFMTLLFVRTGSLTLMALGFGGVSVFAFIAYQLVYHIQVRVSIWQNPWLDPYGTGYQIVQSLISISSYAPFGSGLTNGYPSIIPLVESDFIFSGIAEEFGIIYALLIIGVYVIFFYRGVHIALRSKNFFHSYLAVGFTSLLAFQSFVIIGGVTKLIPLTGVTLPFICYGGTSLVSSILMFGIIQLLFSYSNHSPKVKEIVNSYDEDYNFNEEMGESYE